MSEYICPHCKNPIYDDEALLCLYCGESLGRSKGVLTSAKSPQFKLLVALIALLVVVAFLLIIVR